MRFLERLVGNGPTTTNSALHGPTPPKISQDRTVSVTNEHNTKSEWSSEPAARSRRHLGKLFYCTGLYHTLACLGVLTPRLLVHGLCFL